MPPRFAFWTIVIDGSPTAFRAAKRDDLLPTLKQLQGRNPHAELKWFARGKVWESPEQARASRERGGPPRRDSFAHGGAGGAGDERRGKQWRPGGEHRDPREKFKKETYQARKRREKKAAALARQGGAGFPPPGGKTHGGRDRREPQDRPWKPNRPREGRPPQEQPWRPQRPREGS
ncbi:MAG TPA: hypothetical protein PKK95_05500, partial [Vicinamibacterales bacterium]|nr:hypothetical protein [Vicinamibacterales bacterium]